MFERMRHDFSQVTTLERDRALSHFGVHISPIYYLILPFYMLFPYVETLDIAQTVIVFSAVIPLCLILKKYNCQKVMTPSCLPSFCDSCHDNEWWILYLHENCVLPPLILWLFYSPDFSGVEELSCSPCCSLFGKEDAFVYVLSLGLYFAFQRRFTFEAKFKSGCISACLPCQYFYFALAMFLLARYGERSYGFSIQ